jgi:hypothetical protein
MDAMKLLTPKEVAEIVSVLSGYPMSIRQAHREIKEGHIKSIDIGGRRFVNEKALKHYTRRHPGLKGKNER